MWLLCKFLWQLPIAALLFIGRPWMPNENRYSDKTRDRYGHTKIEYYTLRWFLLIPGIFLTIGCLVTALWYIPVIFFLAGLAIATIDGIMIGLRALWVQDTIKKSAGTDIVVADLWKDKD